MTGSPRYLTKSRFKLACECGTKLFYTKKKDEYANSTLDDPFLAALADSGFQVGELAKCYYPGGVDIKTLGYDEALEETEAALSSGAPAIFEAAIHFKNLFVRADVLEIKGDTLHLLEVKAKSIDPEDEDPFFTKKGTLSSTWRSYLFDVAFQTYVLRKAFPEKTVIPYLYLVNKKAPCPTSGLNQKFILEKTTSGKEVRVSADLQDSDLNPSILIKVRVDSVVEHIFTDERERIHEDKSFEESIWYFADKYERDEKITPVLGAKCAGCEFHTQHADSNLKDGRSECFKQALSLNEPVAIKDTVLSIWNSRRKDRFIEEGKFHLSDLEETDLSPAPDGKAGLSVSERQWLQVEKAQKDDNSPYLDKAGVRAEFEKLTYPIHFIDFETAQVAIPFIAGRTPYEGIAFQFSHHTLTKDGKLKHESEYINIERGVYPNYGFLRALKEALTKDSGSIFRYSSHENTYLNHIYSQLKEDDIPDKEELLSFVKLITTSKRDSTEKWSGERNMLDLCEWVKRYYYDPYTGGSNSIKKVLPAVLNSSSYIQEKYSQPIYGTPDIPSYNFESFTWIKKENGEVKDPYSLLPKIFEDASEHDLETLLFEDDELADGGAALTAYAKLQFTEISDLEREALKKALLKYCELDTLAMVLIFEAFREWLSVRSKK